MEGYIDIHNHSMFGVDDGAKTLEESLALLEMAYTDGIRTVILTPHAHYRRGSATPEDVRAKVLLLQERIRGKHPELNLYHGNELYYDSEMPDKIEYGEVCRLADTNYVLVEFSAEVAFWDMRKAFHEILCLGILPILAHIERYQCLYKRKGCVRELLEMGVYFQANAASVLGKGGKAEKKFLKRLLQKGYLHFIATDAHDTRARTPVLSVCAFYIKKKYGEETAKTIFFENPKKLLGNEMIQV